MSSVFETLNAINCNEHTEKKNNLTYLSWAWAWQIVKTHYPDANYTIYENAQGWNYHTDGRTCWVKTEVEINGIKHMEYLPVMDFRNNSIPLDKVTSYDVNKAIQRSLTKCCARHGLGLYIYAGEDLPDSADEAAPKKTPAKKAPIEKEYPREKWVEWVAKNKVSKDGRSYFDLWKEKSNPTDEEIAAFDNEVLEYIRQHSIK